MRLEQSHLRSDALRVTEFAVDLALHAQRHSSLSKSTKTSYDHYQRLWVEWCTRKGYTDYLVTTSKFQVYMSENLAEDTDEEKDIHPIRIKRKKMEETRNSDTFNKNDYLPSIELVEPHVKALCDLYETQKAKDHVAMAGQDHPRTPGIKALLRRFRLRRGEIAKSSHAETLTVGDDTRWIS
ncbi:hypothetical protein KVV02_008815 [Mortierella alpina]|uniref:Uncharacterized protein n=1 Tax=Mortierella alpina TaxID=64518 RepID=A0A9P8A1J3_MORAP|nr:hypothetical protein KVV02_008815 [Mortierella alpina]